MGKCKHSDPTTLKILPRRQMTHPNVIIGICPCCEKIVRLQKNSDGTYHRILNLKDVKKVD